MAEMNFDLFKEELKRRGIAQSSIDSRGVAAVYDILSGGGHTYQDINKAVYTLSLLETTILQKRKEIKELEDRKETAVDEWHREILEQVMYVEDFCSGLKNCETEKGRDAMRVAQFFVNTVDIDTKYDNTAFIIGLAQILSGQEGLPIDTLRKLNPKLPWGFERL